MVVAGSGGMRACARVRARVCVCALGPQKKCKGLRQALHFSSFTNLTGVVYMYVRRRSSCLVSRNAGAGMPENTGGMKMWEVRVSGRTAFDRRHRVTAPAPPRLTSRAHTQNPSTHSHTPIPPAQTEHKRSAPALEVGVQTRAAPTRVSGTFLRPPNCFHTRAPRSVSPSQNPRRVLTN